MNGPAIASTSSGVSVGLTASGKGDSPLQPVQVGRVAGLDAVDRQRRRQQLVLVDQELRRALVGADAGVLQRLGDAEEPGQVGVAEVVLGFRDRLAAEVGDHLGHGVDVLHLVVADEPEPLVDVVGVAGGAEVVGGELLETIAVEGVLQVLQGQRVVEDVDRVSRTSSAPLHRASGSSPYRVGAPAIRGARIAAPSSREHPVSV